MVVTTTPNEDDDMREEWRNCIKNEGGRCPVCDRWGRIYPRSINRTMARGLIWLCANSTTPNDWVDVPRKGPKWLLQSNQLSTLAWWGLIERGGNDDPATKHSGRWRPTEHGRYFANGEIKVPRRVFTYNGRVEGFSKEMMHIAQCFKTKFDYEEAMSGSNEPEPAE